MGGRGDSTSSVKRTRSLNPVRWRSLSPVEAAPGVDDDCPVGNRVVPLVPLGYEVREGVAEVTVNRHLVVRMVVLGVSIYVMERQVVAV